MVTHMKTTLEISDAVLRQAKQIAAKEKTTLKSLVEEGLRQLLKNRKRRGEFALRNASFKGKGLNPEFQDHSWENVRKHIYDGQGG